MKKLDLIKTYFSFPCPHYHSTGKIQWLKRTLTFFSQSLDLDLCFIFSAAFSLLILNFVPIQLISIQLLHCQWFLFLLRLCFQCQILFAMSNFKVTVTATCHLRCEDLCWEFFFSLDKPSPEGKNACQKTDMHQGMKHFESIWFAWYTRLLFSTNYKKIKYWMELSNKYLTV